MGHAILRPHLVGYAIAGTFVACVVETAYAAPPTLYCNVSQEDDEGVWVASRSVTERDGALEVSRDTFDWQPHERIEFAPGMTLGWSLNYSWPVAAGNQPNIPPEEVTVDLTFRFDRAKIGRDLKRPDRTWLHLSPTCAAGSNRYRACGKALIAMPPISGRIASRRWFSRPEWTGPRSPQRIADSNCREGHA